LATLRGHQRWIEGALELEGGRILSWSNDGTLRIWTTDRLLDRRDSYPFPAIERLSRYQKGAALVLGGGRFVYWLGPEMRLHGADGKLIRPIVWRHGDIVGVLKTDEAHFLSFDERGQARLWTMDGRKAAVFEGHRDAIMGALVLDGGRILTWSKDSTLRIWDLSGSVVSVLQGHKGAVGGARLLRSGKILSWSKDRTLRLWKNDGRPEKVLTGHRSEVAATIELRSGRFVSWTCDIGGSGDNVVRLWEGDGRLAAKIFRRKGFESWDVRAMVELKNGCFVSWVSDPNMPSPLEFWDPDGWPLRAIQAHTRKILGVRLLSDGRIASWSADGTVRLWTETGEPSGVLRPMLTQKIDWPAGCIEVADGLLLTWSDRVIELWQISENPGEMLCRYFSAGSIGECRFAGDDRVLLSLDDGVCAILTIQGLGRRDMPAAKTMPRSGS
jgi:WD40 repeat protein